MTKRCTTSIREKWPSKATPWSFLLATCRTSRSTPPNSGHAASACCSGPVSGSAKTAISWSCRCRLVRPAVRFIELSATPASRRPFPRAISDGPPTRDQLNQTTRNAAAYTLLPIDTVKPRNAQRSGFHANHNFVALPKPVVIIQIDRQSFVPPPGPPRRYVQPPRPAHNAFHLVAAIDYGVVVSHGFWRIQPAIQKQRGG